MLNLTLWLGVLSAAAIIGWSLAQVGAGHNIMDVHGIIVVLGGAASAMLISTPAAQLFSALRAVFWVMLPGRLPSPEEIAAEVARLSKLAQAQGGLLALRGESGQFAGGFLQRSIAAAAACGETAARRQILELEVRRKRIARQEDANVFRTLGTLAPMFGLMGTLIGMLKVLTNMSEPTKLGPAMALALSSAFVGIGLANLLCVPLAGQIRLLAMRETQALEMMIEGVLAIATNQPTYQIELRMGAYLDAASAEQPVSRPNGVWDERDEDLENQLNRSSMWAVTYGDLMSYLMIFFLLLYVASVTRSVGMQMSIKAAEQRFANDAQTIEQMFTKYGAQKIARLEIGENKIRIVFEAPVLFESGSAYLKSDSLPMLQQVVKSISDIPNSIQIEGHTDNRPVLAGSKFDSNWELSAARAFAVLRFLEINGIPEQRLSATGYGEFRPLQSNDTPEGRAANRRIEINIMRRDN